MSVSCKGGGVLPDSGFPRYGGMAIEERAKTSLGNGANTSISYNTHTLVLGRRLRVIPSKRAFGAERVRSGSSCSRVVRVVVVHGSCQIHSDSRRTRFVDVRVDGRGTWWSM